MRLHKVGKEWSSLIFYRRRLLRSPADSHEDFQLELSGLGEASDNSGPGGCYQGVSSPGDCKGKSGGLAILWSEEVDE
ncbi:hypothetical protein QQ045_029919 [Rhodiola kirilowii]